MQEADNVPGRLFNLGRVGCERARGSGRGGGGVGEGFLVDFAVIVVGFVVFYDCQHFGGESGGWFRGGGGER